MNAFNQHLEIFNDEIFDRWNVALFLVNQSK